MNAGESKKLDMFMVSWLPYNFSKEAEQFRKKFDFPEKCAIVSISGGLDAGRAAMALVNSFKEMFY